MPTTLDVYRIRLEGDPRNWLRKPCKLTTTLPTCGRGVNVQVELGMFMNGVIVDTFTNIQTVFLQINQTRGGAPLFAPLEVAVGALTACTQEQWTAGTGKHAVFSLGYALTQIDLSGGNLDQAEVWLVIHALSTAGVRYPLVTTPLTIVEDGAQNDLAVAVPQPPSFRVSDGDLQLYNPTTEQWHTIYMDGAAGAEQLTWGAGEA
jgi:hypothetical protein